MKMMWEKDGYLLRLAKEEDLDDYYQQNYCPLHPEIARLTGSKESFTKEEVDTFFLRAVKEEDKYFFLLQNPEGKIIGETMINEIDEELRCANFRIAIFQPNELGKGIGTWATEMTRDFAFEKLNLHRLELDVFSFNPRAKRTYEKAGFQVEGILKDAVVDGNTYADDILMAILEEEWKKIKDKTNLEVYL